MSMDDDDIPSCVKERAARNNIQAILCLTFECLLTIDSPGWKQVAWFCADYEEYKHREICDLIENARKYLCELLPLVLTNMTGDGFRWLMASGLGKQLYSLLEKSLEKSFSKKQARAREAKTIIVDAIGRRTDLYDLFGKDQVVHARTRSDVIDCLNTIDFIWDDRATSQSRMRLLILLLPPSSRYSRLLEMIPTHASRVFTITDTSAVEIDRHRVHLLQISESLWKEQGFDVQTFYEKVADAFTITAFTKNMTPLSVLKKSFGLYDPLDQPCTCILWRLLAIWIHKWCRTRHLVLSSTTVLSYLPESSAQQSKALKLLAFDSFANGYYQPWITQFAHPHELQKEFSLTMEIGLRNYQSHLLICIGIKDLVKLVIQYLHPARPYF